MILRRGTWENLDSANVRKIIIKIIKDFYEIMDITEKTLNAPVKSWICKSSLLYSLIENRSVGILRKRWHEQNFEESKQANEND